MKVLVVGDVIDDILVTPTTPIRTNTDTNASIKQSPGGSAANFACWLGSISKKTDTVQFVGRVNQEDLARHQKALALSTELRGQTKNSNCLFPLEY